MSEQSETGLQQPVVFEKPLLIFGQSKVNRFLVIDYGIAPNSENTIEFTLVTGMRQEWIFPDKDQFEAALEFITLHLVHARV